MTEHEGAARGQSEDLRARVAQLEAGIREALSYDGGEVGGILDDMRQTLSETLAGLYPARIDPRTAHPFPPPAPSTPEEK